MGNKSRMERHNGMGWASNRRLAEARMPPTRTKGWAGLQAESITPRGMKALPVIYPSTKLGTLRGHINRRTA